MSGYQAVLMAPDGDYVTDHSADTVEEVGEAVANQGSRWIFYPFVAVVRAGKVSEDSEIVRAFGYWGDDVYFDGSPYAGGDRTFAEWRDEVVELCEEVAALVECPKCHGSGKVSPEVVA